MSGNIEQQVAAIDNMPLTQLRSLWQLRYGHPLPLRSVPIMRMMLAWRVQAEAFGALDPEDLRTLARTGTPQAEGKQLGIGATLTRKWKGRPVEVVVEEQGFRWNGKLFLSLSAANAITGSRWNGPRFFGLRDVA
ncbi:DUF2924 domain-containing protein [Parasphingorhabdus sp. DH2-15]|uniref:DUF2924 domain-containing protein n=1 Tax=Parasphingorhabdus sp. DH2-15 TaxID=3444112 RepID=UPI003F685E02